MDEAITTERSYRSPARDAQAQRTRAAVTHAARILFVKSGYGSTTLQQIADEAGVSVQTVYAVFGNKPALLGATLDVAIAGDDRPVAVNDRDWMHDVFNSSEPQVRLRAYAGAVRRIHDGAADMFVVVAAAAAADPALRGLAEETDSRRRNGATSVVDGLVSIGALGSGLRRDTAIDLVWTLNSADVFVLLVRRSGWRLQQYEDWLGDTLVQQLL